MTVVALLHPGAMGAAVGRQAVSGGAVVRWVSVGRAPATVLDRWTPARDRCGLDVGEVLALLDSGGDVGAPGVGAP